MIDVGTQREQLIRAGADGPFRFHHWVCDDDVADCLDTFLACPDELIALLIASGALAVVGAGTQHRLEPVLIRPDEGRSA